VLCGVEGPSLLGLVMWWVSGRLGWGGIVAGIWVVQGIRPIHVARCNVVRLRERSGGGGWGGGGGDEWGLTMTS